MTAQSSEKAQVRILAIDDAPIVLQTYELLFEGRAETASTVADGLAKLSADPALQVVLVDLNMPDGGGVPLLRTLAERFPERLVIVLSGDAGALGERERRELGVFRCLEKGDASFDVLERTIDEAAAELRRRAGQ